MIQANMGHVQTSNAEFITIFRGVLSLLQTLALNVVSRCAMLVPLTAFDPSTTITAFVAASMGSVPQFSATHKALQSTWLLTK